MWGAANAQTFSLGAVLPLSGNAAQVGQVAAAALRASAETLLGTGIKVKLSILDSRSDARYAAAQAQTLTAAGVHALLCCETARVAAQVVPITAAAGVPTLSLAPVGEDGGYPFSLSATETQVLTKLALEGPQAPLVLMTPLGTTGDAAKKVLGGANIGVVRYPAQGAAPSTPLTPEALLAATLEPGSVVLWDDAPGTLEAAEALTARGYSGVRVVRAEVWEALDAFGRAELTGAVSVVSPAVLGYRLPDMHPAKARVSSFRRALRGVLFESSAVATVTLAAGAWDAAQLLGAAAEQVLSYTAPTDLGEAAVRSALRDALIGLGPVDGVGGSYDFSAERAPGLLPESLVFAVWRGGRFFPFP